jgi:trans-2-enoyl-CoA reductase
MSLGFLCSDVIIELNAMALLETHCEGSIFQSIQLAAVSYIGASYRHKISQVGSIVYAVQTCDKSSLEVNSVLVAV